MNTPALLFPAISLVMLAYTNRFLALANRARALHEKWETNENKKNIHEQIKSLKYRLKLIRNMQMLGVMAFLCSILCMYAIYTDHISSANIIFATGMLSFALSLCLSLVEILQSNKAIELELNDMEGLEDPSVIEYIKKKFERG